MKSVKLDTRQLLGIVTANKEKHNKEYLEAVEDYKAAVLKLAAKNHKLAKSGDLEKFKEIKPLPAAPTSYDKEYSRAISMLDLCVDSVVELEDEVFNQLVLDEWYWKDQFSLSNSLYKTMR